jgi:hypothetical protein
MSNLKPTEFTDLQGTVWEARVTIASARRVDSVDYSALTKEKFSLLRPDDGLQGFFGEILTNTAFMFAVLYDLMITQVVEKLEKDPYTDRVASEMEFAERMGGEQVLSARKALWRGLEDFFQDQRTVLQGLWTSYESGLQQVQQDIQELEPEVRELLQAKMKKSVQDLRKELLKELRG